MIAISTVYLDNIVSDIGISAGRWRLRPRSQKISQSGNQVYYRGAILNFELIAMYCGLFSVI